MAVLMRGSDALVLTVVGSSTWSLGHPHCRWVVRTVVRSSTLSLSRPHCRWVVCTVIGLSAPSLGTVVGLPTLPWSCLHHRWVLASSLHPMSALGSRRHRWF